MSAPDLTGECIRREPRRQHAARGEPATNDGTPYAMRDETHQVVAHIVERVSTGCPSRSALPTEIHSKDLEVLGQQRHRLLVSPPGLRLPGDQQQRRRRL